MPFLTACGSFSLRICQLPLGPSQCLPNQTLCPLLSSVVASRPYPCGEEAPYVPSYRYVERDGTAVLYSRPAEGKPLEECAEIKTDPLILLRNRFETIKTKLAHLAVDASAIGLNYDTCAVKLRPVRRHVRKEDNGGTIMSRDV